MVLADPATAEAARAHGRSLAVPAVQPATPSLSPAKLMLPGSSYGDRWVQGPSAERCTYNGIETLAVETE